MFWQTKYFLMDEASEEGGGSAVAEVEVVEKTEEETTADMAAAITEQLKPEDQKTEAPVAKTDAAIKPAEQTEQEKSTAAAAAKVELLKKNPDDFKLTDAEAATLKPVSKTRFEELSAYGKAQYERSEALSQRVVTMTKAHSQLMGAFEECGVGPDDLTPLLLYNKSLKSGDVSGALKWVNDQRAMLMRRAGVEGEGVNLLEGHDDLEKKVTDLEMTREAALEVVKARNTTAAAEAAKQRQATEQNQSQQAEQAAEQELSKISNWSKAQMSIDPAYKAKEAVLMKKIEVIVKEYPSHLWLKTIRNVYDTITIPGARDTGGHISNTQPLRPSGGAGGKKEPATMEDAIMGVVKTTD